jgi:transcriptional repressor NrdR
MRCPRCRTDLTRVIDSRTTDGGVRRRRECGDCGQRFTTYERVEAAPLMVVKRDGRREPFSGDKLAAGLRRACEKRPLATDVVEALVDTVEHQLRLTAAAEVSSAAIGELVMDQLRDLDQVAYIRFASVYRQFADLASFQQAVSELQATAAAPAVLVTVAREAAGEGSGRAAAATTRSVRQPAPA